MIQFKTLHNVLLLTFKIIKNIKIVLALLKLVCRRILRKYCVVTVYTRVNQKVKAIFKLRGNQVREELPHCAVLTVPVEEFGHVQYSALPSVEQQQRGHKTWDAPLQDCTIEERDVVRFLWAGVKPVEIHRRMLAQYGQSTMSQ